MLFSTKGIFVKLAYRDGVDPETLLALRMAIALPIYVAVGLAAFAAPGGKRQLTLRLAVQALLLGLLGYWLSGILDFKGLAFISAQSERLVLYTYPLFVVVFAAMLMRQPVSAGAVAAFAVSYAGLGVVFAQGIVAGGPNVVEGGASYWERPCPLRCIRCWRNDSLACSGPRCSHALP